MTVEMEDDMDFNYFSDSDDGGDEEHKRLLAAISKLDKRKRVAPSERKEPSLQVSEFHLSKGEDSTENTVHLRHLAKSLNTDTNQVEIIRKLRATENKAKTLPKPLEKPAAERIKREVSFKNVQKQLNQWDPIVIKNRVSDDLSFPLKSNTVHQINPKEFLDPNQGATELEREMAAILNDSPSVQKEREEEEEYPLSLEEMIERRKELARLRVHESYRHAKAHRQAKIKSKKFHRFARRERIRKQLKEFEELQEKDPEAALERLAEIEKQRVLERASLRHRSTGKWAQNHAVRAKYDKESRQVLSEQLQINKDLTQKVQAESDSSDEETPENDIAPTDNPWMSQTKTEEDVDAFLSGYRKYWTEKANQSKETTDEKPTNGKSVEVSPESSSEEETVLDPKAQALLASAVESYSEIPNVAQKTSKPKKGKVQSDSPSIKDKKTPQKKKNKKLTAVATGGSWTVTPLETTSTISDPSLHHMFDDLKEKMTAKAHQKIAGLKGELKAELRQNGSQKRKSKTVDPSSLLELKRQKIRIDLDEKLDEGTGDDNVDMDADQLAEKIKLAGSKAPEIKKSTAAPELDPNKFMKTAHVKLKTALPDVITGGDEGMDDSEDEGGPDEKHLTISEAFADDDVVADFSQEKQEAIDKDKPKDINLTLPGWGDWGGHNIKPNKRKQKRFMVKMPEAPPRRDENKGNLIINENEDTAVRSHQVSNLPFPFTSVKDYEASVRAPIGNTFIPESAHRKLTKPSVTTEIRFFNWTNPEEVKAGKAKPRVQQVGPYIYEERHTRVNMKWHPENDTISFQQIRKWQFMPSMSSGTPDDEIVSLNVLAATIATAAKDLPLSVKEALSVVLDFAENFAVKKTVRQLMFDGYRDPILTTASLIKKYVNITLPFDKFGWFYARNMSSTYDGSFNMYTGQQNMSQLGMLHSWNYATHTSFFNGTCGDVYGTTGELLPPPLDSTKLPVFASDLCSYVSLTKRDEMAQKFGIEGVRFEGKASEFDNGTLYPEYACFSYKEKPMPSGVRDMSKCRYGAPAYVSYPHFLDADPWYTDSVDGLSPNRSEHGFFVDLEPSTGLPLEVKAQLQINVMLEPISGFKMYEKVPRVLMPMFYFRQTAELTPELGSQVKILLNLSRIGTITFYGFAGIGAMILAIAVIITVRGNWGDDDEAASLITPTNDSAKRPQDNPNFNSEIY